MEKAALTQFMRWESTAFGLHTPWGGEDQDPVVAPAETELERALAEQVMHGGPRPTVCEQAAGEFLFRQSEPGALPALVLDGTFEVWVDGQAVGQVGPGTVVGERASLEDGRRTADLCALTRVRVARDGPGMLSAEQLS